MEKLLIDHFCPCLVDDHVDCCCVVGDTVGLIALFDSRDRAAFLFTNCFETSVYDLFRCFAWMIVLSCRLCAIMTII